MGLGVRRKAAALPWKLKLYNTDPTDYARAQMIQDIIVSITGQRGGRHGSIIAPRVCQWCHRWGHTKKHCKEWEQAYMEQYGYRPTSTVPLHKDKDPTILETREEYIADDPENGEWYWKWRCEHDRLLDRHSAAWDAGKLSGDEYDQFVAEYDKQHPEWPAGVPETREPPWWLK